MEQVRVSRTFILLVTTPAGLTSCEDHQSTTKDCQEVVRLFTVHHTHLQLHIQAHLRISQMRASQRLRPVAVSARLASSHASYRGPGLVWATGRLMSPDRGFGTSCLLHCGHLTVSANSEDSWKCFCLSRTRLRRLVTLAFRRRI